MTTTPTRIWTDGACDRHGTAGWAWVAVDQDGRRTEDSGRLPGRQSNNRAELCAVGNALFEHQDRSLVIHCDAAYVVNCFLQHWYVSWRRRDWRNSQGDPVANRELWEPLIGLVETMQADGHIVTFKKVKGHSGDMYNEYCDKLAVQARLNGGP